MGLEYIQLFADMEALFEPYDDSQRGRLMMAMMAYAYRGEEPQFAGVEKFIWPVLCQHIDRCAANVEAKKTAGSKGGRRKGEDKQTETEESEPKQMEAETSKTKQNAHIQYHDHDNDHDHTHNHDVVVTRARATAPAAPAEEVIGIDGTDLSESIRINTEVDAILRMYRLSEAVRGDLLDDIDKHGLEKVKRVLQEAAKADTKGGLSLNFYRACLANDGKPKPARSAPGRQADIMQRYTPDERKTSYSMAMVDLDAEVS